MKHICMQRCIRRRQQCVLIVMKSTALRNTEVNKMEFTKDELYELEKICDIYAGWINDGINKYCATASGYTNLLVVKKEDDLTTPLDPIIMDLMKTRDVVKKLRGKLESNRKGD